MSQAGIINTTGGGGSPPNVPTSFQAQNDGVNDGSATPAANIINFNATSEETNTENGFIVSASGNTVTYSTTNRFSTAGSVTTTDATVTTIADLDLATIGTGVFTFDVQIAGYDVTDSEGVGYAIFGTLKNIGGVVTRIGTPDKINNEDTLPVDITAADANLTFSGTNAIVEVTGIAAKTFRWRAVATFVYVG